MTTPSHSHEYPTGRSFNTTTEGHDTLAEAMDTVTKLFQEEVKKNESLHNPIITLCVSHDTGLAPHGWYASIFAIAEETHCN